MAKDQVTYGSFFKHGDAGTNTLANKLNQYIDIYHIPSGRSVAFKAALTQFQDNFKADWQQNYVFGRMDPIGTYKRTTRTLNVGFSVQAADFDEAKNNLGRLSLLSQMMYPSFDMGEEGGTSAGSAVMRGGPLVKIKFLNWIGDGNGQWLMGWIDGVSFIPDLAMGVFQEGTNIYPKKFDITFMFFVVHEEQLGWNFAEKNETSIGQAPYEIHKVTEPFNDMYPYNIGIKESGEWKKGDSPSGVDNDVQAAAKAEITEDK